jgi:hypothetical protein
MSEYADDVSSRGGARNAEELDDDVLTLRGCLSIHAGALLLTMGRVEGDGGDIVSVLAVVPVVLERLCNGQPRFALHLACCCVSVCSVVVMVSGEVKLMTGDLVRWSLQVTENKVRPALLLCLRRKCQGLKGALCACLTVLSVLTSRLLVLANCSPPAAVTFRSFVRWLCLLLLLCLYSLTCCNINLLVCESLVSLPLLLYINTMDTSYIYLLTFEIR